MSYSINIFCLAQSPKQLKLHYYYVLLELHYYYAFIIILLLLSNKNNTDKPLWLIKRS